MRWPSIYDVFGKSPLVRGGPSDGLHYAQHRVSPEYFSTLGIRLQRGRVFTTADGPNSPQVAVVSASTAQRLWPDRDPIGKTINLAGTRRPLLFEVVGVVSDVRFRDLTGDLLAPLATIDVYFPFAQQTDETIEIAVRGESDPSALAVELQRSVRDFDVALPLFDVAPLRATLAEQTSAARFGSLMLSLFAGIAIVLAAVGIYGLLAFVVETGSREIAIRIAFGAAPGGVVGVVVRKGVSFAALGVVVGLLIAVFSTRVLSGSSSALGRAIQRRCPRWLPSCLPSRCSPAGFPRDAPAESFRKRH
ncbi:MAG TPA: ABC transporter permease [Gemmatimonadaceae bacterium]|nr:ABC transporter permease [Gemmatimonadaceae bacterium]